MLRRGRGGREFRDGTGRGERAEHEGRHGEGNEDGLEGAPLGLATRGVSSAAGIVE